MGQGFAGPQGAGMGLESFPRHAGWAGMVQEKTMRDGDKDPILWPCPIPLPSHHLIVIESLYYSLLFLN